MLSLDCFTVTTSCSEQFEEAAAVAGCRSQADCDFTVRFHQILNKRAFIKIVAPEFFAQLLKSVL